MTDERSAAGGRRTQVRERRILIGLEIVVENDTEEYFSVMGAKTPSDGDISPTSSLHRLM